MAYPRESESQISLPQLWKESSIRDTETGVNSAQHGSAPHGLMKNASPGNLLQPRLPFLFQERRQGTQGFLRGSCTASFIALSTG